MLQGEIDKVHRFVSSFISRKQMFFLDAEDVCQGVCEIMLRRHGKIDHRYARYVVIDFLRTNYVDPRRKCSVEAKRNMIMPVEYLDALCASDDNGYQAVDNEIDILRLTKGMNARWQSFVCDWMMGYSGVELAKKYNVSESRISEMRREAIKGMRNELAGDVSGVYYPTRQPKRSRMGRKNHHGKHPKV